MTEQMLSDLDLEDLKGYPVLWRDFQRWQRETRAEAIRESLLGVVVVRFNPPASEYLEVERALAAIDDPERLRGLLLQAAQAGDFAAFVAALPPAAGAPA